MTTETLSRSRYQILGAIQLADVATTWAILHHFTGHSEGNPVVAGVIGALGLSTAMLSVLTIKLSVVYVLYQKQTIGTPINLITAVYTAVIFNNLLALALAVAS